MLAHNIHKDCPRGVASAPRVFMNIVRCSSIYIYIYTYLVFPVASRRSFRRAPVTHAYLQNSEKNQHTLNKPSQRIFYSVCNSQADLANYNWGCGHRLTTITNQDHISVEIQGKGSIINTYWNSKVTAGKKSASHPSLRATQSVPGFTHPHRDGRPSGWCKSRLKRCRCGKVCVAFLNAASRGFAFLRRRGSRRGEIGGKDLMNYDS